MPKTLQVKLLRGCVIPQKGQPSRESARGDFDAEPPFSRRGVPRKRHGELLLKSMVGDSLLPRLSFRRAALSTLARAHLHRNQPYRALLPLLEIVKLEPHDDLWDIAMHNLALTWWKLGRYDEASNIWREVVSVSQHAGRRAHAHTGLGNVAMRLGRWSDAIRQYRHALAELGCYQATDGERLRVLNNLLVCYITVAEWEAADDIIAQASTYSRTDDTVLYGEFLATQAEWAWKTDRPELAGRLIALAKENLGSAVTVSWFMVRLLELVVSPPPNREEYEKHIHTIDVQLAAVADERWMTGLRLALIRASLDYGDVPAAVDRVTELQRHFWGAI